MYIKLCTCMWFLCKTSMISEAPASSFDVSFPSGGILKDPKTDDHSKTPEKIHSGQAISAGT